MTLKIYISLVLLFLVQCMEAQNLGLLTYNKDKTADGYTMIYPHNQPSVFLINNCGNIVHRWDDTPNSRAGNTAYLLPNGNLVKTKRPAAVANDPIWAGGGGGTIEIVDWDNNVLWSYTKNDSIARLHHDIKVMPNGNILAIVWEKMSKDEAISLGRNPSLITQDALYPDAIYEINPASSAVVWSWHVKDHLVQDFDPTKPNYGVVADHPELVDFNYDTNNGAASWMHTNAIDYNAELDQILISIPYFSEIWIIDHTTTTAQAASHNGGKSNRGGDLMYRIGNPAAYKNGSAADQDLFFQHNATWIQNLPFGHPDADKILVFNNRKTATASAIEKFSTPWNMYDWDYSEVNSVFLPLSFENTITHPGPRSFFSAGLSSAQILPNNNILMLSGSSGYITEMTQDKEIVWEYVVPLKGGQPQETNATLASMENNTFRAYKYPSDYLAFMGKDLTPKGNIELNPDLTLCDRLVGSEDFTSAKTYIYPNPTSEYLWVSGGLKPFNSVLITDQNGRLVKELTKYNGLEPISVSDLPAGIYYISLNNLNAEQFIKK
ncbi:MAG TPA: aryl-sulfate sulfotransferase [Saprospiraceae bacterium]|nr:aryl-sulfate sulfotransferase [Saprospiraceae bacterium]